MATAKLHRTGSPVAPTRYAELASTLVRDIVEGRRVVGSLLPTEHDLAEQHGVSRHTVRASLRMLQDLGYISRKKAVGTIVESAAPGAAYTQSFGTAEDLVRVAATEIRAIEAVRQVTLDRPLARRLEAPVGGAWIQLSGLRVDALRGNTPVARADIYLDASLAGLVDTIQRQPHVMVSALIERECAIVISEIRQLVTAVLIASPLAEQLVVAPDSAGLRLVRHYKDAFGRILEITDTIYPADRVSVAFQLKRGKAGLAG
ncbi:GntR family transcriptional regulator [Cupriavidus taiwanensis]|uniref:Transcriptional regulator, GntR family n=1 Tax=Cupriavidus taiwanensis TaxID=164546 RepID=A0A375I928_9BURK|nr:GntR family transcriptional regulator [Cupriavidus taiwanensis]SOZ26982.1 Transcriptional regulator, GntR family [Cupriavidus taiwanensis]SPA36632.1 Transcriptional regulator, GntR family [Cupriavidus taiwanensis]SPK69989.1 Transcriptional regulator, GntR family [Cupriavidus taiwanensis]SPK74790.1 Transcriptional regulator, GntR family [Cupriavidus taiwanensis]